MSPESRAEQVQDLVRKVLGETPMSVTHMDFGHQSLTYEVTLPDFSVMVRTNRDLKAFTKTAHNLAILAGLGLPVSQLLAADLTGKRFPFAYLIVKKIPGRDLRDEIGAMNEAEMTRLAEQIVGFQRQAMALPAGKKFGYAPLGETGAFASLWEFLHEGESATAGVMEPRLEFLVRAHEDYFRQAVPICFLDDLTIKNVIVQDGELQGLVDFDFVCYGDPLFWLGLTATVVVSDLGPREMFYVDALCREMKLTVGQQQIVALYAAWISLGFVQKFASSEGEAWRARIEAAREQWLSAAK